MSGRIELKPGAGALLIVPAWDSCGSYEVFKGQVRTLTLLGYETFLLAAPSVCLERREYREYRRQYRRHTADLACTARDEARHPLLNRGIRRFRARTGRTAAYQHTEAAQVMRLPRSLRRFLRGKRELFVLCNHYFNVPFVESLQNLLRRKLRFVLETHEIQSRHFRQRFGPMSDADYDAMLAEEIEIAARAAALIHINNDEYQTFAAALPDRAHHLVYPALPERQPVAAPRADTTFLIVAAPNIPNAESLAWFLDQVWSRYAGAGSLRILGGVDVLMARLYPEVLQRWRPLFLGRVEDLAPHYASAAVVVIPVVAGEGISIKFAEAVSYGKRMLFTPHAVRGLPARCVETMRDGLCADADAMLAKLSAVPGDSAVTVNPAALQVYRALFSVETHLVAYHGIVQAATNLIGPR